jgi:hypothetical protein
MIELDPVIEQAVVDLALAFGDDAVSGAAEIQRLHIRRQSLDDEDRADCARDQVDHVRVFGDDESICYIAHHPGARPGHRRDDQHRDYCDAIGRSVLAK